MINPLRLLLKKWFGITPAGTIHSRRKQRAERRPHFFRPQLDGLEDRTLLSTNFLTNTFTSAPVAQFSNASVNTFVGKDAIPGSGDTKAGVNFFFAGDGGTVKPTFSSTVTQTYAQPDTIDQWAPIDTSVDTNLGSFFGTTTPQFGYGAE